MFRPPVCGVGGRALRQEGLPVFSITVSAVAWCSSAEQLAKRLMLQML